MWTNESLNYLAGILDGEGSIGIEHLSPCKNRVKDYYTCRLCVINTSLTLVNWLKDNFKGQINIRKRVANLKICYRWHIFGTELENVLRAVEPFLKLKRKQAQLVLQYRETVAKTGWIISDEILDLRKSYWLKCKELNQVGE